MVAAAEPLSSNVTASPAAYACEAVPFLVQFKILLSQTPERLPFHTSELKPPAPTVIVTLVAPTVSVAFPIVVEPLGKVKVPEPVLAE